MSLLALSIATLLARQEMTREQIVDGIATDFMAKEQVPGLSIAILQGGEVKFIRGYGVTDLDTKTKVTEHTVFPIASLSKPFVAMGILKLAEGDLLSLRAPIGKYLTDLPPDWKLIPLIHLLDHTSGVPDHINSGQFHPKPEDVLTSDDVYHQVTSMGLRFEPGLKYEYSNGNYVLLARIIEKVTNKPYAEYLNDVIFKPLGMTETYALTPDLVMKAPKGYRSGERVPKPMPPLNSTWVFGNGQLASSVADLAKWDAGLYTNQILVPTTLQFITTDQGLNNEKPVGYAMGWKLTKDRGFPVITHDGRYQGFRSYFARYAKENLTIIILANHDSCDLTRLARRVVGTLIPGAGIPLFPIRDDFPALTQQHLRFIRSIIDSEVDPRVLSPALQQDWLPKKYGDNTEMFGKDGEILDFYPVERKLVNGLPLDTRYRMEQRKASWIVHITCDSNGIITGLFYEAS